MAGLAACGPESLRSFPGERVRAAKVTRSPAGIAVNASGMIVVLHLPTVGWCGEGHAKAP